MSDPERPEAEDLEELQARADEVVPEPAELPEPERSLVAAGGDAGGGGGDGPGGADDGDGGDDDGRGRIRLIEIEQEVQRSYIDYAMSVIVGRALPDARDGLKPVHRRILYGMEEAGMRAGTPYKKCARIVGDVMGKYHPHGDSAIYDALARMAQPFAMRHPLIDGQGNFGSVDGHPPAAMRYTECRLAPLAMEVLRDLDEGTVDMVPNYDGEDQEPIVLPGRFPNLLVNGSTGIAVGMATNMPPHNLGEAIDAVVATIDDPDIDVDGLMKHITGPDFPSGAQILGIAGIRDAYTTGRGTVRVRAKCEIEESKGGRERIVITELPYMVSGDRLLEKIKDLTDAKKLVGISDGRNETNRLGTRIVLELKKGVIPQVVLNNLYKQTQLQDSFGIIQLALVDGVPRVLTLKQLIEVFIQHQREVVRRRTEFRLKKAKDRLHIVDGLLLAIDHIDEVIALIRASASAEAASIALMERFGLSDVQARHILDMQLRRLAALERDKLRAEAEELRKTIAALEEILGSEAKLLGVIKEELLAIRTKFANPRRTEIAPDVGELALEDLIADEEVIITITRSGYVKRVKNSTYKLQGRGGKGVIGAKPKEGDIVTQVLTTTNHAFVLVFSSRGKVYRLRAHEFPEKDRTARGVSIRNLLPFTSEEQVAAVIDTRDFETHKYLVMATKKGIIKRTLFSAYDRSRKDGLIALNVRGDDELIQVRATSGEDELIMVSRKGMAITFPESDVRPMGRTAGGVIGIRLNDGDEVVAFDVADPNAELLIVTDAGYGKRTLLTHYPRQRRGGKGVLTAKLTHSRGSIQGAGVVRPGHEVFLIATDGQVIRMTVKSIARQGRGTTGVRMMRLDPGVSLTGMAPVAED